MTTENYELHFYSLHLNSLNALVEIFQEEETYDCLPASPPFLKISGYPHLLHDPPPSLKGL